MVRALPRNLQLKPEQTLSQSPLASYSPTDTGLGGSAHPIPAAAIGACWLKRSCPS